MAAPSSSSPPSSPPSSSSPSPSSLLSTSSLLFLLVFLPGCSSSSCWPGGRCPMKGGVKIGTNVPVLTSFHNSSLEKCCQACRRNSSCQSWVLDQDSSVCEIRNSTDGFEKHMASVSGTVRHSFPSFPLIAPVKEDLVIAIVGALLAMIGLLYLFFQAGLHLHRGYPLMNKMVALRLCLFAYCALQGVYWGTSAFCLTDGFTWSFMLHIFGQVSMQYAFLLFVLVWVDMLGPSIPTKRNTRFKKATAVFAAIGAITTTSAALWLVVAEFTEGLLETIFGGRSNSYQSFMILSSVVLLLVSCGFVAYALVVLCRVMRQMGSRIRQKFIARVALSVVLTSLFFLLRVVMLLLLVFVKPVNGNWIMDDTPWYLLSQFLPFGGIYIVMVYYTMPHRAQQAARSLLSVRPGTNQQTPTSRNSQTLDRTWAAMGYPDQQTYSGSSSMREAFYNGEEYQSATESEQDDPCSRASIPSISSVSSLSRADPILL